MGKILNTRDLFMVEGRKLTTDFTDTYLLEKVSVVLSGDDFAWVFVEGLSVVGFLGRGRGI